MKILYFAWLRHKTGVGEEDVSPPDNVSTVEDLVTWLSSRGENFADAFSEMTVVRAAVNQEYVDLSHPIVAGDEVAFFPPVTGG